MHCGAGAASFEVMLMPLWNALTRLRTMPGRIKKQKPGRHYHYYDYYYFLIKLVTQIHKNRRPEAASFFRNRAATQALLKEEAVTHAHMSAMANCQMIRGEGFSLTVQSGCRAVNARARAHAHAKPRLSI